MNKKKTVKSVNYCIIDEAFLHEEDEYCTQNGASTKMERGMASKKQESAWVEVEVAREEGKMEAENLRTHRMNEDRKKKGIRQNNQL